MKYKTGQIKYAFYKSLDGLPLLLDDLWAKVETELVNIERYNNIDKAIKDLYGQTKEKSRRRYTTVSGTSSIGN